MKTYVFIIIYIIILPIDLVSSFNGTGCCLWTREQWHLYGQNNYAERVPRPEAFRKRILYFVFSDSVCMCRSAWERSLTYKYIYYVLSNIDLFAHLFRKACKRELCGIQGSRGNWLIDNTEIRVKMKKYISDSHSHSIETPSVRSRFSVLKVY